MDGYAGRCRRSLKALVVSGFSYRPSYGDAPDSVTLLKFEAEFKEHIRHVPLMNATWKTLAAGALHLMETGVFPRAPRNLRDRKNRAEDFATEVRTANYNYRREWYRGSNRDFIKAFPRPDLMTAAAVLG